MSTELSTSLAEIIRSQEIFSDDRAVKTSSEEFRRRDSALRRLEGLLDQHFRKNELTFDGEVPQFSSGGGMGIASPVAWLRIFDSSAPKATQGWYLTLFFGPGGGGFYLSLSQGVNYGGTRKEGAKLVTKVRRRTDFPQGLMEPIDLGLGSKGRAYKDVTPLARYFSLSQVEELDDDEFMGYLEEFSGYLKTVKKDFPQPIRTAESGPRSWLIQYSPEQWDFDQFLSDGNRELAFKVGQFLDEISIGDIVYMWKSGKNGGFVAKGKISQPPIDGGNHDATLRYYKGPVDEEEVRTRVMIEIEEELARPILREQFR